MSRQEFGECHPGTSPQLISGHPFPNQRDERQFHVLQALFNPVRNGINECSLELNLVDVYPGIYNLGYEKPI